MCDFGLRRAGPRAGGGGVALDVKVILTPRLTTLYISLVILYKNIQSGEVIMILTSTPKVEAEALRRAHELLHVRRVGSALRAIVAQC